MQQAHIEFISNLFPFHDLSPKTIEAIFEKTNHSIENFSKGDIIFSPSGYQKKLGFIIDGECKVERLRNEDDGVPLNTLKKFDSFGILAIFSNEAEYPTRIKAIKPSTVLFIDGADMLKITKKYPTIAMNVISFLTGRISFLNKKIATFSGKSTSEKLATYLYERYSREGSIIKASITKLSAEISVGRASVYRDLEAFEKSGIIAIEPKKIIIICPEGLERITK